MTKTRVSYSFVYNSLFLSRDKDEWVKKTLQKRRPFLDRYILSKHLVTAVTTQYNMKIQNPNVIFMNARLIFLGWIIYRLRPLQVKIIKHLWRPGGKLMMGTVHDMLS